MTHELYKTKNDIEDWLKKYQVTDYELIEDSEYGYVVNVNSYVNLSNKNLKEIKIKFNKINGSFYYSASSLKSLKGCPEIIEGDFNCSDNELTSLEYCPMEIKGIFFTYNNHINSLEHFPRTINGEIYLINNLKLGEVQNINDFEELKKIHELIVLNKKLQKEIIIEHNKKKEKIKL